MDQNPRPGSTPQFQVGHAIPRRERRTIRSASRPTWSSKSNAPRRSERRRAPTTTRCRSERIARDPAPSARGRQAAGARARRRDARPTFAAFPALLRAGDVLVLNETRVIPARLRFARPGGGAAEILLLRPADRDAFAFDARDWLALVRPARRLPPGRAGFGGRRPSTGREAGRRRAAGRALRRRRRHRRAARPGRRAAAAAVRRAAAMRREPRATRPSSRASPGSVAAPTASLHFTAGVLAAIAARGVEIVRLTLDVGIGTFRPMRDGPIDAHRDARRALRDPAGDRRGGRRGRRPRAGAWSRPARRSCAPSRARPRADGARPPRGRRRPTSSSPPGFRFRVVDALLTNFHLPQSTLLVFVSAFAGYERMRAGLRAAHRAAITDSFRLATRCSRSVLDPSRRQATCVTPRFWRFRGSRRSSKTIPPGSPTCSRPR